jgi:hypothetical protein
VLRQQAHSAKEKKMTATASTPKIKEETVDVEENENVDVEEQNAAIDLGVHRPTSAASSVRSTPGLNPITVTPANSEDRSKLRKGRKVVSNFLPCKTKNSIYKFTKGEKQTRGKSVC